MKNRRNTASKNFLLTRAEKAGIQILNYRMSFHIAEWLWAP
jgi:hypothetical protein